MIFKSVTSFFIYLREAQVPKSKFLNHKWWTFEPKESKPHTSTAFHLKLIGFFCALLLSFAVGTKQAQAACSDAPAVGVDWSNCDFSSAGTVYPAGRVPPPNQAADLSGLNLTGANLMNAILRGVNLGSSTLNNANLTNVELAGSNIASATFTGANLMNANLMGVNIGNVDFTGAVNISTVRRADPTTAISGAPTLVNTTTPFMVTVTFSENMSGFIASDFTILGGTVTGLSAGSRPANLGGAEEYTATITPDGTGPIIFSVPANRADDLFSHGNQASNLVTVLYDAMPPTVVITGVPASINMVRTYTATFTFNELVTGFDLSDISTALVNGTATNFTTVTPGLVFTALITMGGGGDTTIGVNAGAAIDLAGNPNVAATPKIIRLDTTGPVVTEITPVPTPAGDTTPNVTFNTTEDGVLAVTGECGSPGEGAVSAGDNTITLTQADNTTPLALGTYLDCFISVRDGAGNTSNILRLTAFTIVDTTAPTVVISDVPATSRLPFTATFTFSENVMGFTIGGITAGNATLSDFMAVSATTYTVLVTPTANGQVTIDVPAGAAVDAANNGNEAAVQAVSLFTKGPTVEETQAVLASFLQSRASNILGTEPDLIELLDGFPGGGSLGTFQGGGTADDFTFSFASSRSKIFAKQEAEEFARLGLRPSNGGTGFDVWTQIHGSKRSDGNAKSSLWAGYLGAHFSVTEDMVAGGLFQLDYADEKNTALGSEVEGFGWLVGPYLAGRAFDRFLSYEARAAWGQSNNEVSPDGTYTDEFATERFLLSGKIGGSFDHDWFNIRPELKLAWFSDKQEAYIDSLGQAIPEQEISLGQLSFGPELVARQQAYGDFIVEPTLGFSGVWDFDVSNGGAPQNLLNDDERIYGRIDVGLRAGVIGSNTVVSLKGYLDGLGTPNYQTISGSLEVSRSF